MEIAPLPKPTEETNKEDEVVKEQDRIQIVTWVEQLALPELYKDVGNPCALCRRRVRYRRRFGD